MTRTRTSRPSGVGLALIQGDQWAITEAGFQSLVKAASTARRPKGFSASALDATDDMPWCMTVDDGIATIRVRGPLMRSENWLCWYFGWTSYDALARAYVWALSNASVRSILFDFDSPGGAVSGVSELAAMLYKGRGQKPQESYVSGLCCSAALWLGAAIGRVSAADVSLIGSIGTMFTFLDTTKYDRTLGIEEKSIISSQTPKKNADPTTPEGKADMQTVADDLADIFIDALAEYRNVPRDTVINDFGQGAVMVASRAVDVGLADEVVTEAQLIQDLLEELNGSSSLSATLPAYGGRASTATTSEAGMNKPTARAGRRSAPQGTAAAGDQATTGDEPVIEPAASTIPAPEAAKKKTKAEDTDEQPAAAAGENDDNDENDDDEDAAKAQATMIAQAKAEERDRVQKIRALAGPADLLQACVDDPECTPADAAYRILTGNASVAKPKSRLAALRGDDAGPHASATAPKAAPTTPREAAKASVDRYYQNTKPAKGATSRNG